MRSLVQQISKGLDVLNCYAYSGGFSLQALAGGAHSVDSVDSSSDACQLMEKNLSINSVDREKHRIFCQDAFTLLQEKPAAYDLVILDPPAFVKREKDKTQGRKKYLALNRLGLRSLKSSGFLLTASCSYFMDESSFLHIVLEACKLEGRTARILSNHRMALDHPSSIFHREGAYLKSLLLYVES
jgi:23S rRNA (cytosine1962-C5)-methyltransferase